MIKNIKKKLKSSYKKCIFGKANFMEKPFSFPVILNYNEVKKHKEI